MTFDPAVPLNSDSPSTFPAKNQINMTRLQTILGADHQFNLSPAADDGYHNIVHMTQQAPSGVLAATGRFYAKSSAGRIHCFYMDDTGAEYQITPTAPIRAMVNFDGTGTVGTNMTIRSQYNILSVFKSATGSYTINFSTAMPDANYIVMATGMRNSAGDISNGLIAGNAVYSNSVTQFFVKVEFNGGSSTLQDVLMGNIIIMSVT